MKKNLTMMLTVLFTLMFATLTFANPAQQQDDYDQAVCDIEKCVADYNYYVNTHTTLGAAAKTASFEFKVSGKDVKCTKITSNMKKVEIPATVKDNSGKMLKVTSIGKNALKSSCVTTITIPETVKTIDKNAFKNCKKLKKVIVKGNIKKIGKGAFKGCSKKIDVVFKANVNDHTKAQFYKAVMK